MNELLSKTRLLQRMINLELINRTSLSKLNIKGIEHPDDLHCFYLKTVLETLALSIEIEKNLIMLGATIEKGNEVGERPGEGPRPEMEGTVPESVPRTSNRVSSY